MRKFNPTDYIENKLRAINQFFNDNGLDSVVLGVSGGVDSAVVLLLYQAAARCDGSPIKKVLALTMPIFGDGTSGQSESVDKARWLKQITGEQVEWRHADLTHVYNGMVVLAGQETSPWANGQMASVLRTPMLYYQAALLQQDGLRSCVSGTTNRDEGSFIGFFGKASDGMVDVQPIADIHKSEVYKVARMLGVPDQITGDEPRGDVWDNKTDEQMIGAPYWFLQEFIESLSMDAPALADWMLHAHESLGISKTDFDKYCAAIMELHKKNEHKYRVGSPAHFIDVMPRTVPGGWN